MAVNPYKQLDSGMYGPEVIERYRGAPRGANAPHIYALSDRVQRALTAERKNQSIIVSGESGAGTSRRHGCRRRATPRSPARSRTPPTQPARRAQR